MVVVSSELERAAVELRASLGPLVRRLRQVRPDGELSLSQLSVLVRLERDGSSTPGALAVAEEITAQSMGALVAALERHGLVSRTADPQDGRRALITITAAGRRSLAGVRQQRARRLAKAIAEELTAGEQRQLVAAIPLLARVGRVV